MFVFFGNFLSFHIFHFLGVEDLRVCMQDGGRSLRIAPVLKALHWLLYTKERPVCVGVHGSPSSNKEGGGGHNLVLEMKGETGSERGKGCLGVKQTSNLVASISLLQVEIHPSLICML